MKLALDGVEICYQQSGCGQDIVWLAGGDMPGSSWHPFQLPAFMDYTNTTFDARGAGQTESFTAPPWPISTHAADCIGLIEAVCEPPVFLAGLSMGSCIAQEISLTRPDLVRASILMGACARKSGFIGEWESAEIALRRNGVELPEDFAVAHYALLMYPASVLGDDELWSKLKPLVAQDYGHRNPLSLAEQWQACVDYDSLDRLPACEVPLHVIAFSEDTQTPPPRGKLIADTAPVSSYHLLEGLGHCSLYGHKPDVVNQCIREILSGYPG
jgi:pimeloyl-ACP methyl ester carboxylesterase